MSEMSEPLRILLKCRAVVESCVTFDQLKVAEKFVKTAFREKLHMIYPEALAYIGELDMRQYQEAAREIVALLKKKKGEMSGRKPDELRS